MDVQTERDQIREENAKLVFDFIRDYIQVRGISPTFAEIGAGVSLSRAAVVRYVDLLEARGYISRIFNVPRSIRIQREWL
ncbi:MAG: transcriptional regulator [Phototrophicales bacterium]|nr:MAG: transcriptional regulator [Phototrophicales bacterium]RMG77707.1 MAG: transcriptional regulator [Chloroflexota bacterium]